MQRQLAIKMQKREMGRLNSGSKLQWCNQ